MSIAGARPNFMKLASIVEAVKKYNQRCENTIAKDCEHINHIIVHTGQHYDQKMSHSFFQDLGLPEPDINLEVGSGSHAVQTAETMKRFEPVLLEQQPDILLVVGDVNSTIACTLVASKISYPEDNHHQRPLIVHVEAGLRSFDREMPEEVNRVLTDAISDVLFVTEESGRTNLLAEGVAKEKIYFVGNVMIDTLQRHIAKAAASTIRQDLGIEQPYALITLHRPSNVDKRETLKPIIESLLQVAKQCYIVFPIHPRTRQSLEILGLLQPLEDSKTIIISDPLGYLDFLCLLKNASVVITDSGGIQEETTALDVPCVTLRESTERPVTIIAGSNYLIGTNPMNIIPIVEKILKEGGKKGKIPELWDGYAGERILNSLISQSGVVNG